MDHKNGDSSTNLQRQKRLITASNFVCCNASSQRLPWLFYEVYFENGALFGRPQGRHGGDPSFQQGADVSWGKAFTDSAPGPGSRLHIRYVFLYTCRYLYVYVYMYICMYIYKYIYIMYANRMCGRSTPGTSAA